MPSLLALLASAALAASPEGLPGTLAGPSARVLEHGRFSVGLSAFGHNDGSMVANKTLLFYRPGDTLPPDTLLISELVSVGIRPHLALGLWGFFDLGVSVPVYVDLISEPPRAAEMSGVALGDLRLLAKLKAPLPTQALAFSIGGGFTLPSNAHQGFLPKGSEMVALDTLGRPPAQTTFSAEKAAFLGLGLASLDLTVLETPIPFRLDLSAGLLNQPAALGGARLVWNGSLEWSVAPQVDLFAALSAQATVDKMQGFGFREEARLAAGVTLTGEDGFFVNGGFQLAVSDRPYYPFAKSLGTGETVRYEARAVPGVALAVQVGWTGALFTLDADRDGVPDKVDACPREKEDADGFQDSDGCPDPDNDEDGICDEGLSREGRAPKFGAACKGADQCPNHKEDFDGFQDEDGCPDPDNDDDGILDPDDKCPNDPEDKDGFQDDDGCPDLDNDGDGVLDPDDKCKSEPEDKDGFQDDDGCPDPDNDGDGLCDPWVADSSRANQYLSVCRDSDKCPDAQGPGNSQGCPGPAGPSGSAPPPEFPRHGVLKKVRFQGRTAALTADSYVALDSLAEALKRHSSVTVEIRVHLDEGNEKSAGALTQSRADAIRKHLVLKGVERFRLFARGMGAGHPVASNRTAQGRQQNRRVEIVRVDEPDQNERK